MRKMRICKSIALVLALAMAITFAVYTPVSAATTGGWSVSKARYSFLSKSQKKVFNKATEGMTGVSYEPVALLAKQTVAGTNYFYLCQGTTVTAKPVKSWYVLSAFKSLDKEISLNSSKKIGLSKIKTKKKPSAAPLLGGFEIVKIKNKSAALSKSVSKVFNKATKKYKKYKLRPIALLGTQVVAGKNYRFLCYGSSSAAKDIFVVDIYKDLKGKCKVTSCKPLKLEKYIENATPTVGERRY